MDNNPSIFIDIETLHSVANICTKFLYSKYIYDLEYKSGRIPTNSRTNLNDDHNELLVFLKNFILNIGFDFMNTAIGINISMALIRHMFVILHHFHETVPLRFDMNNNSTGMFETKNDLVVNLSQHTLTQSQYKVLSRGLKFCPNPGEPDVSLYQDDLDHFHLRLKRYLHFLKPKRNEGQDQDLTLNLSDSSTLTYTNDNLLSIDPFKHQKFKNPSAWQPPPILSLENFISRNNNDLANCNKPKSGRDNISSQERVAMRELARNPHLIIKQADKGGAVVLQDRDNYVKEGLRQLSDPNFYEQQTIDLTTSHHREIVQILDDMLNSEQIDKNCHEYLSDSNVRTAEFYMLPKIHKNPTNPPGRPIVSGNGCPTEQISKFIDHFLQPCVKNIRSYIKDTTDFLLMLDSVGPLPQGCILVTLDVASLYTNIPNLEGCQATLESLTNYRPVYAKPANHYLIALLKKVLTCNNFDFNGKHYLQVGGTAMGTKVAPAYANTFMGWFEENHVYTYHTQPLLWKRFIDDIFVIWPYSQGQLDEFVTYLNSRMPSIKFEAETSTTHVHFLDVTVQIQGDRVETTLYTKPTDSHNYINYESCHPRSCKQGIPYGQFLRLRRICSKDLDFINQSKQLAFYFHKADYPSELLQLSFERAYLQDRKTLLVNQDKDNDKRSHENSLFLITTYHPTFNEVNRVVSSNMDLLDKSSSTRPALQAKLIRGYRRCKNLRDILVRAKLKPLPDPNILPTRTDNTCRRAHCAYCTKLDRTGRINAVATKRNYTTRTKVSCLCTNLIYAIVCRKCGKTYIGQTKRRFMDRMMEHFRNVRQNCQTHIVSRHYTRPDHEGISDMILYILEFIPAHPNSATAATMRIRAEKKWIFRLRTQVPAGLNIHD